MSASGRPEANLLKELPAALKEEVEYAKVLQQVHHLPCTVDASIVISQ